MPALPAQISVDSLVLAVTGQSLLGWVVGWARALPVSVIVPAFGMPGMPASLRGAIALSLSGIAMIGADSTNLQPSLWGVFGAVLDGMLIAIPAALGIWIATMAGSLYDELTLATAEGDAVLLGNERGVTGKLFGMVACVLFLGQGGTSRIAEALLRPAAPSLAGWKSVVATLTSGIGLSVTLAAPLVGAAVLMEVAALLVVRQSPTLAARHLAQVIRGFAALVVLALFLQWILSSLAAITR